jgi:hypothetical protein
MRPSVSSIIIGLFLRIDVSESIVLLFPFASSRVSYFGMHLKPLLIFKSHITMFALDRSIIIVFLFLFIPFKK